VEEKTLLADTIHGRCVWICCAVYICTINRIGTTDLSIYLMEKSMKRIWKGWLKISEAMGNVVARIVLTVFYFVLFSIPSLLLTFVFDKVGKNYNKESYFKDEKIELNSLDEAREM